MKFSLLLLFAISSTAFARGPAGSFRQVYGPLFHPQPNLIDNAKKIAHDPVHHWNQIAIFDAINAMTGQYQSYTGIESAPHPVSIRAAVAQAAHDALVALYPSQRATFDQALADDLLRIISKPQKNNGITFGKQIAAAILASRVADGAEIPELHVGVDYSTSNLPGHWRQDPISLIPIALGAHWGG